MVQIKLVKPNYDLVLNDSLLSKDSLTASPKTTSGHFLSVAQSAYGYKRSLRLLGGFWESVFNLSSNPPDGVLPVPVETLLELFYSKLGLDFEERVTQLTWKGYLHEIYLSTANSQRVRSYDNLVNCLLVIDENCTLLDTIQNDESILRYGKIEKIIDVSKLSSTGNNITNYLNNILNKRAWARPEYVGRIETTHNLTLQLRFKGYINTAAFRYFTNSYTDIASDVIMADVINDVCDYLDVNTIDSTNLLITNNYCYINGLKVLLDLANYGSDTNPIWQLDTYNTPNKVNFIEIDASKPKYFINWYGDWTNQQGSDIALNPRLLTPASVEDTFFPVQKNEPDSILPKSNMLLATQITVNEDDQPEFTTDDVYDEIDLVRVVSNAKTHFNKRSFENNINYNKNNFVGS